MATQSMIIMTIIIIIKRILKIATKPTIMELGAAKGKW